MKPKQKLKIMTLSANQIKKVEQAISETERMLSRALRYSEDLQDKNLVNFCKNHLIELKNELK